MTYGDWLDAVFKHPIESPRWWLQSQPTFSCCAVTEASLIFCTHLFEHPDELLCAYSTAQMEQGFLFLGSENGCLRLIRESSINIEIREQCVKSMFTLYEKLFTKDPVITTCYMWWEIVFAFAPNRGVTLAEDHRIREAIFNVMKRTLTLHSPDCDQSVLHGLGHLASEFESEVAAIIDEYLEQNPNIPGDLRAYALNCRSGYIL